VPLGFLLSNTHKRVRAGSWLFVWGFIGLEPLGGAHRTYSGPLRPASVQPCEVPLQDGGHQRL
jgi:hypothetical protein